MQISLDSAAAIPAPYACIVKYDGLTVAAGKATSLHYVDARELNLNSRIAEGPNNYFAWLIRPGDCARSMEAAYDARPKGDFRLYAARTEVPATWYRRSGTCSMRNGAVVWADAYGNASARFAHGLRHSSDWQYWGHFCSASAAEWNMYPVGGGGSGTLATHPYRADAFELTGDNTREAPYGQIYPRLTTKSNVYQVHYKARCSCSARCAAAILPSGRKGGTRSRGSSRAPPCSSATLIRGAGTCRIWRVLRASGVPDILSIPITATGW